MTFSSDVWTFNPPSSYSMNPSLRNLFMKKLIRERVVPTRAARISDGPFPSLLAEIGQEQEKPGQAAFARIEQLVDQVRLNLNVPRQHEGHDDLIQNCHRQCHDHEHR